VNLVSDDELALHSDVRGALQALCTLYASLGESFCHGERAEPDVAAPALSRRELQCVFWMSVGKTDAETGAILGISALTVKGYVETAKRKLGVSSRPALSLRALALGLLLPDENARA
jgi:DNA-binding CsgD family transcriptional regulator